MNMKRGGCSCSTAMQRSVWVTTESWMLQYLHVTYKHSGKCEVTHLGQSLLTLCAHIPSTCAYLHDCRSFCFFLDAGQLRLFLLLSCGALKVTVSVWLIGWQVYFTSKHSTLGPPHSCSSIIIKLLRHYVQVLALSPSVPSSFHQIEWSMGTESTALFDKWELVFSPPLFQ